jgi:hypothetical protein
MALAGMHALSDVVAKKFLPPSVLAAAGEVCTADGFLAAIAAQWPWLVDAAIRDRIFGTRSMSTRPHLEAWREGARRLAACEDWLANGSETGLLAAYAVANKDGLIDAEDGRAQMQRDIEGVVRMAGVLRHFSGLDDAVKRKKVYLPSLARHIRDLHRDFKLDSPPKSRVAPAVSLMMQMASSMGVEVTADAHVKALQMELSN